MESNRRALIIGIDHYQLPGNDLTCAVADAEAMAELLQRDSDGAVNYHCRTLLNTMEDGRPLDRVALRLACQELFSGFKGDSLLYFSGHGVMTKNGGCLATYDAYKDDWGVPMDEILQLAEDSTAREILILADCCHSGDIGNPALLNAHRGEDTPIAVLREDLTVIAASHASQLSLEAGGHGLFTAAVLDALRGGAADHMGWVTAPSIYAYVERRFGPWEQRPIYKSHATGVMPVRKCAPLIDRLKLRRLVELFPTDGHKYPLDPEHEPEDEHGNLHEPVNKGKVAIAQLFKDYRDAGLVRASVPGEQLFWTARRSHAVALTGRGREYWWLVKNQKI